MTPYSEPPIQQISDAGLMNSGVKLFVLREDMNGPYVSGNKWWKLKYNLLEAQKLGFRKILTFGGAYSNHIYATAAAAKHENMESIGIIRGEKYDNRTLKFAESQGMQLHFVSREDYRQKNEIHFQQDLFLKFGKHFLIPEGGSNTFAVKGCTEWAKKIQQIDCDVVCLPVGTGGTMAGLLGGILNRKILGFSALKGGGFLEQEIKKMKNEVSGENADWQLITDYHFGGYAKSTPELIGFIKRMYTEHQLLLDPVYTSKMMFGIMDMARKGVFKRETKLLVIHTGGLQGLGLEEILEDFRKFSH